MDEVAINEIATIEADPEVRLVHALLTFYSHNIESLNRQNCISLKQACSVNASSRELCAENYNIITLCDLKIKVDPEVDKALEAFKTIIISRGYDMIEGNIIKEFCFYRNDDLMFTQDEIYTQEQVEAEGSFTGPVRQSNVLTPEHMQWVTRWLPRRVQIAHSVTHFSLTGIELQRLVSNEVRLYDLIPDAVNELSEFIQQNPQTVFYKVPAVAAGEELPIVLSLDQVQDFKSIRQRGGPDYTRDWVRVPIHVPF